MTLEETKLLNHGAEVHHNTFRQNKGCSCQKWRVTGKVRTWKRSPWKVRVPIMWGLYGHGYLTEGNIEYFHLGADCELRKKEVEDEKVGE